MTVALPSTEKLIELGDSKKLQEYVNEQLGFKENGELINTQEEDQTSKALDGPRNDLRLNQNQETWMVNFSFVEFNYETKVSNIRS